MYEGSWDVAENKVACLAFFIFFLFFVDSQFSFLLTHTHTQIVFVTSRQMGAQRTEVFPSGPFAPRRLISSTSCLTSSSTLSVIFVCVLRPREKALFFVTQQKLLAFWVELRTSGSPFPFSI